MRFQCQKTELVRGVQAVERAVASRDTIQVLSGIHLDVNDSVLTLTATDLELGIQYAVPVMAEDAGSIVLDAKYFSAIVRRLPEETVWINYDKETHMVQVKSGRADFSIISMSASDFPGIPNVTGDELVMKQADLGGMISQTVFAVSKDDTRPVLTGVLFETQENQLRLVATDGNRMAYRSTNVESTGDRPVKAIIPSRTLGEVNKLLSSEGDVTLKIGDSQVQFELEGAKVTTRLIEGQYPNYQQAIPKQKDIKLILDRKTFISSLDRASLISKEGPAIVILSAQQGILSLKAQESEVGQVEEQLEVEQEGDPVTIAFQARFVLDMLKSTDDEKVELLLNGGISPGLLRPISQENYVYVVMPVRVAR